VWKYLATNSKLRDQSSSLWSFSTSRFILLSLPLEAHSDHYSSASSTAWYENIFVILLLNSNDLFYVFIIVFYNINRVTYYSSDCLIEGFYSESHKIIFRNCWGRMRKTFYSNKFILIIVIIFIYIFTLKKIPRYSPWDLEILFALILKN
jgi:hypothetical protein